jgi:hypothetical protein
MSIIRSKRNRTVILGIIGALVVAGGAIAFWTTSGTGSGTATVGTDAGVTFSTVTYSGLPLYPGTSAGVNFTLTNASASAPVRISSVVADNAVHTNGISGLPVGCQQTDFTFPNLAVNQEIPAGGSLVLTTGTLQFANTAVNQDACENASPVLHLKVN